MVGLCAFSYREANTCCCCMISSKLAGTENKTTITDPTLYLVLRVKRLVVRVLSECCLYSLSFHRLSTGRGFAYLFDTHFHLPCTDRAVLLLQIHCE